MTNDIIKHIYNILNQHNVPEDTLNTISNDLSSMFNNSSNNSALEFEILQKKLSMLWQENYDTNFLLVQRALKWLNLAALSEENSAEDEIEAILRLLQLGKILSEDLILPSDDYAPTILTKNQAIEERNKLMQNKDFMFLLNNKTTMGHTESVEKLNKLNSIIAKN